MPTSLQSEYRCHLRSKGTFGALYTAIMFLSLHWALIVYVNSSLLREYVSDPVIGILYTTGASLTILIFLFISRVLHRAGNFYLTILLTLLEVVAMLGMSFGDSLRIVIPFFVVHLTIVPLILFNLDIFMEELIGTKEHTTGGSRGLLLAIMSTASALAPLSAGFLLGVGEEPNYTLVYSVGALLLVPFLFVVLYYFKSFCDPHYREIKILPSIRSFWIKKDIRNVFLAHFLLQLFFALMVIYSPLYLVNIIGLSWEQFGLVMFVGLSAYIILEYPIGIIADRYIGEKEMMAFGFVVMAIASSWFAFVTSTDILPWMIVAFATRVGASFVETTSESYFFKHTTGTDTNIISFFRITRPLAYVFGALVGSLTLLYLPFNLLFVVIGLLMIPGLFFTMALKDTK